MKKTLKFIGAFSLIIVVLLIGLFSATAAGATIYTEGNYKYTVENNEATICGVVDSSITEANIPSTLGGVSVTTIGYSAFSSCTGLQEMTLPFVGNTLNGTDNTHFGYIFGASDDSYNDSYVPSSLKKVTITKATTIGNHAFYSCSNLTSITIPDSVTTIGQYAFDGCTGLTSITIPDGVITIGDWAFDGCTGLTSITIPDRVTTIGNGAFNGCYNLISITIPDGVTTIGANVFEGCTGLTSITIPDRVTTIGNYAFYSCTGLTSITIPASVTDIYGAAFYGCTSLTDVWYTGTRQQRERINIGSNNTTLTAATWHYDSCPVGAHNYSNSCDTTCNECGASRTTTHQFGDYVYNKDATEAKDGTKTRTCSVCSHKETIVAEGTKLEKTLIDSSKVFKDVPAKQWYKKYVDYAVTYGIFSGTSSNTFSPDQNMTRAQFVQVFANISGIDTSNKNVNSGFSDVPKGKWYTAAVAWAAKNGIVSGVGGGKFDPNAKVTREQMCLMLVNYVEKYQGKSLEATTNASTFADDKKISKWAKTAVYKCAKAGLVNGVGNNKFDPKASATRAQGATLFTNFYKQYMK